jgi:O-antigen ligase
MSLDGPLAQRAVLWIFFALLAAFTLATGDGGTLAPLLISAPLLLTAAVYFAWGVGPNLRPSFPVVCLAAVAVYGVLQTLLLRNVIAYLGWSGVLFWFTALAITALAECLFRSPAAARNFRAAFILFGTAVCLLDLLERASGTNRYFWLFPSRYSAVFGPFAYWNNLAQFVELVLPVTLWRALGGRRIALPFALCAALQIGAAVASGSRAGAVLVFTELFAVIAIAFEKHRNKTMLAGAGIAVTLTLVFVYAAGFHTVIGKLQQNDQLAVRRKINRSSLAMIRERPLTGWGLDSYVPVYRQFALYDDGTYVNRAHNDWFQWAAEGGIPFALVLFAVAVWTIRPAARSGWALGLIAVALHALVDYPFARLGVCGWYFCLLGMLAATVVHRARHTGRERTREDAGAYLRRAFPLL